MVILQHTWYILIGVLLAGYSVLDGFDLGVGIMLPFLAKKEEEKRQLFKAVGPFWDGNEVWLLTAGGALFAAFPNVYATVFSGFYLAIMLLLFALIFRAVSLEFWAYDTERKTFWQWTFTLSSLLVSVLFGVVLGNVIVGVPLDARMEFTGTFFTLLRPFPLALGALGLLAFMMQGTSWSAYKTSNQLHAVAQEMGWKLSSVMLCFFPVVFILGLIYIPGAAVKWVAYGFAAFTWGAVTFYRHYLKVGREFAAFLSTSAVWLGLWGLVGAWQFPVLVRASNDAACNMTLFNVSSSQLTLTVMAIIAGVGMPIVIAYTVFVYRLFKGKVVLD